MKNNNLHSKMALERGNSQGKGIRTALAGVGFGLVTLASWSALDSEPDNDGQIVNPQEDIDDEESVSEAEKDPEVVEDLALGVEAKVLKQLKIPLNLPPLKGVKEETLQEKSKRFLQEVDQWLHVPAKQFDLTPEADIDISAQEREHFMNYKQDFKNAVDETRKLMKDDLLFWESKRKIDAAFPNYELMGEQSEGTNVNDESASTHTFFYLMERPKLTDSDGKTIIGFKPPSPHLVGWKFHHHNGIMNMTSDNGGVTISGTIEHLIARLEEEAKRKALMDKYHDPELATGLQLQGFK